MSEKFKAVVIDNQNERFSREIKEINKTDLKDGNVLVKIDYSSLNYKDALILNNGGKIVRKFPIICICFVRVARIDIFNILY